MLTDRELAERIASFPDWHYDFDLRGQRTMPDGGNDADARAEYFFDPVVEHYGGSLAGKRVVDLGCNAGWFSLRAVQAGAEFVLGVDGRQMHVDQAHLVFEVHGIDPGRYRFEAANVLDVDYRDAGPFDVVLCLGLLYHLAKPVELFERMTAAEPDVMIIETKLSQLSGPLFELEKDRLENLKDSVDYELVMVPTAEAVLGLARLFGYEAASLRYPPKGKLRKYRYGIMHAFVCARDSSVLRDFEVGSLEHLHEAQRRGAAVRAARNDSRWSQLAGRLRRG